MTKAKFGSQESLSLRLGHFLLSKGFEISPTQVETTSFKIFRKDPEAKPRKYLFGLITKEPPEDFLGIIELFPDDTRNEDWIFYIHGRKHVELIKQLADDMASTFSVKITIKLIRP